MFLPLHSHLALNSSFYQGPLVFLLVLSVSGKIALTTKVLEAERQGTLTIIHHDAGNARFGIYPFCAYLAWYAITFCGQTDKRLQSFLQWFPLQVSSQTPVAYFLSSRRADRFASFGYCYQ